MNLNLDFGKLSDLPITFKALDEFIKNYIYVHPKKSILLRNLSNLYILNINIISNSNKNITEEKWKQILTNEQYNSLINNNDLIIGYFLLTGNKSNNKIHYIELIDTRVPNNNFAKILINKYENLYLYYEDNEHYIRGYLVPLEINNSSTMYWKKYFENNFLIKSIDELNEFIKDYNIDKNYIKWDHLYNCYNEENN
jgi:hypothetical protein